jgi:hypothetical protein
VGTKSRSTSLSSARHTGAEGVSVECEELTLTSAASRRSLLPSLSWWYLPVFASAKPAPKYPPRGRCSCTLELPLPLVRCCACLLPYLTAKVHEPWSTSECCRHCHAGTPGARLSAPVGGLGFASDSTQCPRGRSWVCTGRRLCTTLVGFRVALTLGPAFLVRRCLGIGIGGTSLWRLLCHDARQDRCDGIATIPQVF